MARHANAVLCAGMVLTSALSLNFSSMGGEKTEPFVISEDFTDGRIVSSEFKVDPKNWNLAGGVLKTSNALERMVTINVGESNWQDYEVEFKVKRINVNPGDQHFGIFVRRNPANALRFYSRGDDVMFLEVMQGKETRHGMLGKLPKPLGAGETTPWTAFRVVVKDRQAKVYVDNALVGAVDDVIPECGEIMFYAYKVDLCLDDFKVLVMKSSDKAPGGQDKVSNILNNSGFEQCSLDKLPDYWGCVHFGIIEPYWVVNYDEWVNDYGVDEHEAFEGKRSMRINNPFDKPNSSSLCLRSVCLGTKVKQKYTFSAYMRSQPSGMKVSFNGQEIALTDKWQRYSNLFVNDGKAGLYGDMLNVYPLGKGAFWIDAAQLEEGEALTPYRGLAKDASLQVQEGKAEKVITEVPKFEPKRLDGKVKLDGRLDEPVWGEAGKLELVNINGQPAAEPTEARIWYGDDGIYIGVKCFDGNAGKNVCKELRREGCVWNDPSMELFVDPKLTRNYYYHLGVNQIGTQFDAFCGDVSWDGSWRAGTYTDPKGEYWSAEVFLPFGEMGIDRGTGEWMGLNICRTNRNKKEYTAWSPTFGGFHTPERFGQARIAQDVLNRYCFECCDAEFQRVSDDKVMLSAKMANNSGKGGDFLLEAALENTVDKTTVNFKRPLKLADGGSEAIALGEVAGAADTKYNLRLRLCSEDGGKVYYTGNKYLEMPCYFQLLPQYSLYTKESEMRVKAKINLSEDSLRGAKLKLALCDSTGGTVSRQELSKLGREMDITFGIRGLADGKHSLDATLENAAGKKLASLQVPFRKMPPVPHEVKVDHLARMVAVDGKPFMPLGFAWEGELTPDVLGYLSRNGVNSISFGTHGDCSKTQAVLDGAGKLGLMVKIAFSAEDKEKTVKFMERFKGHPALLAWDIFDEAFTVQWGKEHYQLICDRCAELKEVDPYHPVFINDNQYGISYLRSKNLEFPGDIISIDYYAWPPSGNFPITSRYAQLMESMGRKEGQPSWIYLLAAGYAFWASRDLTPAEQEFSTYASVINGVSGFYYWASHPKSKSQWERIKRLFRELEELTPALAASEGVPAPKCAAPSIEFLVRKHEGAVYLVSVNSSREPVDARFDLSSLGLAEDGSAEVLFEGRSLDISKNLLADRFEGFQRHVYKIEHKAPWWRLW